MHICKYNIYWCFSNAFEIICVSVCPDVIHWVLLQLPDSKSPSEKDLRAPKRILKANIHKLSKLSTWLNNRTNITVGAHPYMTANTLWAWLGKMSLFGWCLSPQLICGPVGADWTSGTGTAPRPSAHWGFWFCDSGNRSVNEAFCLGGSRQESHKESKDEKWIQLVHCITFSTSRTKSFRISFTIEEEGEENHTQLLAISSSCSNCAYN